MSYDHELVLISETIIEDDIGNQIPEEKRTKVLCKVASIGSSEFYNAAVSDLKPDIKFIIHSFEYSGEKAVEFEEQKYKVIRTYKGDNVDRSDNALKFEEIELTCEKVIGNG